MLGAEHPDTLTVRANLADAMGEAGDPAAARDRYAGLLPLHERILGPSTGRRARPPRPGPLDQAGGGG